jgi:hypothetical protein
MAISVDICILPVAAGSCGGNDTLHVKRYYFDDSRGMCLHFAYSGCEGNLNNFESLQSCMDYCQHRKLIELLLITA